VGLHGGLGDVEPIGDLRVGEPVRHGEQHLALAFGQALERRVLAAGRRRGRDRVVPEDIMRRMAAKLKAPAFDEGFAKITVVRVKKKD